MSTGKQSGAGRVAIVTGAARGIGQSIALTLARQGMAVAIFDVTDASETVRLIQAEQGQALAIPVDITSPDGVAEAVAQTERELGICTVLVNNAGIHANPMISFQDLSFETWRRMFSVNVDAQFLVCRAVIDGMRRKSWGRIINMASASTNALTPPGMSHYIAAKSAVVGLTRGMATDLGEFGITVNAIAPSGVDTPGLAEMSPSREIMQAVANAQAIKRTLQPQDIDGVVAFLASDAAAMITAQTIFVDGGAVRAG